jgi:hypothetical protein
MLGLSPNGLFPGQAKPGEIFQRRLAVFRAAAGGVDILEPQQEPPAIPSRRGKGGQGRKGIAAMKSPGG